MLRKIITYSTLGENMKEIMSSATTLGELQPDLTSNNVRFEGMKLMTNPGQVTLESLHAQLPDGEFQLFIMPQKVKSGHDDSELVDKEDGETWDETDWRDDSENPDEHIFISHKDLAIARAKKAFYYLEKAIHYLSGEVSGKKVNKTSGFTEDPIIASLRAEAAKLQRNMEVFG